MRRGYFFLLKLLILIVCLGGALKLLAFLPLEKAPLFLTDKIAALQKMEKGVENWLADFAETFRLVAVRRGRDRQYEILYRQQRAAETLLQAAAYENNRLRAALRFQRGYSGYLTPAEITGRSADQWFRFVLAGQGAKAGVRAGQAVIAEQGLVGYAEAAGADSARVILITDPLVNVSCVNERTGAIYVLAGKDHNRLELKYATQHSDIQEGDRLLTSGYSYRYKKGLPVGVVTRVELAANNLTKKVVVTPCVDLSRLDIIFFVR
ncbi:MAG: rod shape-determining protein MreC [Candidatus Margulisbacteria bacterium]|jgi:rod shape-determining protein MreC|nr:rod shape-determining protein MreC [Candidatus Margulisiibacteriota bacterium]